MAASSSPPPDYVPLQRSSRSAASSSSHSSAPSSYTIRSTALSHGTTHYTPAELARAEAAAKADDTVHDQSDEQEDAYEFDGDHKFVPKHSGGSASSSSWWPLALLQRRARGARDLSLPQSMPLLGGARDDDDKKPLGYMRAAWGRVETRLPHSARRPLSFMFHPRNIRRFFMGILTLVLLALIGFGIHTRLVRPPPYQLIPRQDYVATLSDFVKEHNLTGLYPAGGPANKPGSMDTISEQLALLQDRLHARNLAARCAGTQRTVLVPRPVPEDQPASSIPSTMYSSDRVVPPANESEAWRKSWADFGFSPVTFLTEEAADAFVDADYGPTRIAPLNSDSVVGKAQSAIQKAWYALPRGVLRADFMRYLLLLSRGGTWSDMDVEPMGNLTDWTKPDARWIPVPRAARQAATDDPSCAALMTERGQIRLPPPEPVRLVVGLECEPWQYMQHSSRAWLETARIVAMPRHREFQFTQWTLHGAPGHPVLLDVVRRLLAADKTFDDYVAHHQPFRKDATHPWTDIDAARKWVLADSTPQYPTGPADDGTPSWLSWPIWPWHWAWPRWGWHPLSVEEWTGPALWTDAVFTYLNAVAGLKPWDLYGLNDAVQVGDVIVAPNSWFAPPRDDLRVAKVLHNFRGSWKHGADIPAQAQDQAQAQAQAQA